MEFLLKKKREEFCIAIRKNRNHESIAKVRNQVFDLYNLKGIWDKIIQQFEQQNKKQSLLCHLIQFQFILASIEFTSNILNFLISVPIVQLFLDVINNLNGFYNSKIIQNSILILAELSQRQKQTNSIFLKNHIQQILENIQSYLNNFSPKEILYACFQLLSELLYKKDNQMVFYLIKKKNLLKLIYSIMIQQNLINDEENIDLSIHKFIFCYIVYVKSNNLVSSDRERQKFFYMFVIRFIVDKIKNGSEIEDCVQKILIELVSFGSFFDQQLIYVIEKNIDNHFYLTLLNEILYMHTDFHILNTNLHKPLVSLLFDPRLQKDEKLLIIACINNLLLNLSEDERAKGVDQLEVILDFFKLEDLIQNLNYQDQLQTLISIILSYGQNPNDKYRRIINLCENVENILSKDLLELIEQY